MTASLRPVIADILRGTLVLGRSDSFSVVSCRNHGAALLDYIEATEHVDELEICQDDLAQAEASVDELQTDLSDLRDALRKLKAKNAELKSEVEGRRVVMDELGLIEY